MCLFLLSGTPPLKNAGVQAAHQKDTMKEQTFRITRGGKGSEKVYKRRSCSYYPFILNTSLYLYCRHSCHFYLCCLLLV